MFPTNESRFKIRCGNERVTIEPIVTVKLVVSHFQMAAFLSNVFDRFRLDRALPLSHDADAMRCSQLYEGNRGCPYGRAVSCIAT